MSIVLLQLPKMDPRPNGRPRQCPYCGSQILQRWGRVTKPVKARTDLMAVIYRYRCQDCKKTFRDYPEGVDRSVHTRGIRKLAAVLSAIGLSCRNITDIFQDYGINLSHSTIWREGKELENKLKGMKKMNYFHRFITDKDDVYNLNSKFGVIIALDFGGEDYTVLGALNENNPSSVLSWLRPMVKDAGIKAFTLDTNELELFINQ